MADLIETVNSQFVGIRGGNIVVARPKTEMSKEEALRHAAWLVVLTDPSLEHGDFSRVLNAIEDL